MMSLDNFSYKCGCEREEIAGQPQGSLERKGGGVYVGKGERDGHVSTQVGRTDRTYSRKGWEGGHGTASRLIEPRRERARLSFHSNKRRRGKNKFRCKSVSLPLES